MYVIGFAKGRSSSGSAKRSSFDATAQRGEMLAFLRLELPIDKADEA
jgi:hypothetical protein